MSDAPFEYQFHPQLAELPAEAWNALIDDGNPFVNHHFLNAMEQHGCVGERYGWLPCHLSVHQQQRLVAAVPLYIKTNSYGEFVFDHSWAQAWQQVGLPYFPKLVSAVPYSPVTGPRFLVASHLSARQQSELIALCIEQIQQFAQQHNLSGWHILFAEKTQQAGLATHADMLIRHDCHFHWFNRHYGTFDDFLQRLTPKKRKNIRQERAHLVKNGISLRQLDGYSASDEDWENFSYFYHKTFSDKMSLATFNTAFFKAVAHALPDKVLLVLADNTAGECVGGALMYRSDTVLYGRHWGCKEEIKFLHFEACYYQGIDYAIQHGLECFEPGAGGEHKIARGFVPVITQSAHWLHFNPFAQGIQQFLTDEKAMIENYYAECLTHSPYAQESVNIADNKKPG